MSPERRKTDRRVEDRLKPAPLATASRTTAIRSALIKIQALASHAFMLTPDSEYFAGVLAEIAGELDAIINNRSQE